MEAVTETQVNLKELTKDLEQGLANANSTESDNKNNSSDFAPVKSALNLGSPLVKIFCKVKNGVQFGMVTKNLSQAHKDKLQHFREVKDAEIAIYKNALDQYGTEYLSPEIIQMINKYANSPLAPLIEFEIEKFNLMRLEVSLLVVSDNKEGE